MQKHGTVFEVVASKDLRCKADNRPYCGICTKSYEWFKFELN